MSNMTTIIAVAGILFSALAFVLIRNAIIAARNRVEEGWSGIDVQLKRRHDLIPSLVETVKGYAAHERGLFEEVTRARAEALRASGVPQTLGAEQKLSGVITELRAVAEGYPALRASENFQQLQAELSEIEDEIQAARRIYNSNVQAYNTHIQVFPNSIVARSGGFRPRDFFQIDTAREREPVPVSF